MPTSHPTFGHILPPPTSPPAGSKQSALTPSGQRRLLRMNFLIYSPIKVNRCSGVLLYYIYERIYVHMHACANEWCYDENA